MFTIRELFIRRRQRVRYKLRSRAKQELPRLSVFRSNKHMYAQIINDFEGRTLASASTLEKDFSLTAKGIDKATMIGKNIGERAKKVGIEKIVFDRGGYMYHGRVKAIAEAARDAGLKF